MREIRYGLTREQYELLLESQNGRCAICRRDNVRLVVDHDHEIDVVRGLLCDKCNHAIGYLEGWMRQIGSDFFYEYLRKTVNI